MLMTAALLATLEIHSAELIDSQPELFAQHYTEAGWVKHSDKETPDIHRRVRGSRTPIRFHRRSAKYLDPDGKSHGRPNRQKASQSCAGDTINDRL